VSTSEGECVQSCGFAHGGVDQVAAVGVDEIREARRAADAGKGHDLLLRIVQFFEDLVERGEHGEVAAAGAPRGMVGDEDFFGERSARGCGRGCESGVRHLWKG